MVFVGMLPFLKNNSVIFPRLISAPIFRCQDLLNGHAGKVDFHHPGDWVLRIDALFGWRNFSNNGIRFFKM